MCLSLDTLSLSRYSPQYIVLYYIYSLDTLSFARFPLSLRRVRASLSLTTHASPCLLYTLSVLDERPPSGLAHSAAALVDVQLREPVNNHFVTGPFRDTDVWSLLTVDNQTAYNFEESGMFARVLAENALAFLPHGGLGCERRLLT